MTSLDQQQWKGLIITACKQINPSLIYVALVWFGQSGPYAKRPAYDDIIRRIWTDRNARGREGDPTFRGVSM